MAQWAATSDTMFQGYLEPELAQDYFKEVEKTSVVQQLARKVPMGPTGLIIPHWTGDVTAEWVDEGAEKPITKGNMTKQNMAPKKIATIFAASAEVVRADPAGYLQTMRTKVAEAIALAFDRAALAGTDTPFGAYIGQTTKTVQLDPTGTGLSSYTAINAALGALVGDERKFNGILFDDVAEPILNAAVDTAGRPLFIDPTYGDINAPFRSGRVLGRPTFLSDHVANGATYGYAGDWSQIIWGQIGGLSFDVTDQATLDFGSGLVSLWQNNLVAVRVEAEYSILVNDPASFVKLKTGAVTHTVTLTGVPTGGTWTPAINGKNATSTVAFDAAAATLQAALRTIPGAGSAVVSGSAGGPYTVTVIDGYLDAGVNALTGGTLPGVSVTTE